MENTYGIGITNRFELFLDDESDPFETIKLKEQEKELKKKTKVAEKENKVKTEPPVKPKPPVQKKPKEVPPQQTNKPEENRRNGESGYLLLKRRQPFICAHVIPCVLKCCLRRLNSVYK